MTTNIKPVPHYGWINDAGQIDFYALSTRLEELRALYGSLTEGMTPGPVRTNWFRETYPALSDEMDAINFEIVCSPAFTHR